MKRALAPYFQVQFDNCFLSSSIEILGQNFPIRIAKKTSFNGDTSVSFPQLLPGDYDLFLVEDRNNNELWDPFDGVSYVAPEKRIGLGRKVRIKANFDHEIEFFTP